MRRTRSKVLLTRLKLLKVINTLNLDPKYVHINMPLKIILK